MRALPMYPCIVTTLRQHIDVDRRLWIDSLDLIIPDTETEARWTVFGRLTEDPPPTDLPAPMEMMYEYGRLDVSHHTPAWLTEYSDTMLQLKGLGKASVIDIHDTYRIDQDTHGRRAYLERCDDPNFDAFISQWLSF
jgi:hypothetical protein